MAIRYEISRVENPLGDATVFETRARKDSAADVLYREIYAMLGANALLDRPVARRLYQEFMLAEQSGQISAPDMETYRLQRFKLTPGDSLSPYVEFRAIRESV